jgi:hypothetical protein
LWYCNLKQPKTQEQIDRAKTVGIQIQNEELILVSDEEEELTEHIQPEALQDDEPFDLDKGSPDYKQMWVPWSKFPNFTKCEPDNLCQQPHRCAVRRQGGHCAALARVAQS